MSTFYLVAGWTCPSGDMKNVGNHQAYEFLPQQVAPMRPLVVVFPVEAVEPQHILSVADAAALGFVGHIHDKGCVRRTFEPCDWPSYSQGKRDVTSER